VSAGNAFNHFAQSGNTFAPAAHGSQRCLRHLTRPSPRRQRPAWRPSHRGPMSAPGRTVAL